MHYSQAQLEELVNERRALAIAKCRFLTPLAGGQPATDSGLRAFIEHHLKLAPGTTEFEEALARIPKEEIGERDTTPPGGEVQTQEVYGVKVIRANEHGPFLLAHMIKACVKQAASRLGLFQAKGKVGSKGDVAELGTVGAYDASLVDPSAPWEIYLRYNGGPAPTEFKKMSGRVNTAAGAKSIQHHTELAPAGTEFTFLLRWPALKITVDDMPVVVGAMTQIGLGSVPALGYGKFEVVDLLIEDAPNPKKN